MQKVDGLSFPALGLAWLGGSFVTYFLLGFLENFYPQPGQIFWVGFLLAILATGLFYYFLKSSLREPRTNWRAYGLDALTWLICLGFTIAVVILCLQFPDQFDPALLGLDNSNLPVFATVLLTASVCTFFLLRWVETRGRGRRLEESQAFAFARENIPGLALSALFFVAYYSLAITLGIMPDDNFYDTDSASWFNRFAAPADELIEMRPVHPFSFLLFRPLTGIISVLLAGNKLFAVLFLNSFAGALCVFLAWRLVKERSRNKTFALLVATLLGLTTSHLVLSVALETYIFSAAVLISFLVLIQRANPNLKGLVLVGLLAFGITLTNFIQSLIMFGFMDLKIPKIGKYVLLVITAALVLAFLQAKIYPTSQPFYIPSNLLAEDRYAFDLFHKSGELVLERANALGRTITLFSVVAPRPLMLLEETGCTFPCFQTYKHRWNGALINSYAGFGSSLARTWFLILLLAGGLFGWKMIKSPTSARLQAALLSCILFNFVLHMNYGDDPLLYSGNWTYAVVFFTAFSFIDLADNRWFQAGVLTFITALMINNWSFLHAILTALAPYYS